jgi:predicted cation transporter
MGWLISGRMLIPGDIPNIVAASRLGITSREWAGHGLRIGAVLLILCFGALCLLASF